MLTKARATEIYNKQCEFPDWGNYTKFMTPEEEAYVMDLFNSDPDGSITVAKIVLRIMHGT